MIVTSSMQEVGLKVIIVLTVINTEVILEDRNASELTDQQVDNGRLRDNTIAEVHF